MIDAGDYKPLRAGVTGGATHRLFLYQIQEVGMQLHPEVTDEMLTEYVYQSNAIEGYSREEYGPGTRIFDGHMSAARNVRDREIWYPREIHFTLMHGILDIGQAGVYRSVDVYIGGSAAPSPGRHLFAHIERFEGIAALGPKKDQSAEDFCWEAHHYFECTHPFIDGNGRTGRLILNGLRLRHGLPWLTISEGDEQMVYYRAIQRYRKEFFDCHELRNKAHYKTPGVFTESVIAFDR